ncbi:MAG: hypothetical protein ABI868_11265 [Acidobacteriota bacterium]
MNALAPPRVPDYGPRRLTVELTNVCNLHCSYCLRDEDALHHNPANFLPVALFGGRGDADIVGDLRDEPFAPALARLRRLATTQSETRLRTLIALEAAGETADLTTGSPCHFCLKTLGKLPWESVSSASWVTPER